MLITTVLSAEEPSRQEVAKAFQELLVAGEASYAQSISDQKVSVTDASVTVASVSCQTGIKIWFKLEKDGSFINPTLRRWDPNDQFQIYILTPVPVYVALFQNYPEDRPATKQILPDKHYPATFCAVPPGRPYCLPVRFKMDNDMRNEILSFVISRIDEPRIGGTRIVSATAIAATENSVAGATATVTVPDIANRTDPPSISSSSFAGASGVLMGPSNDGKASAFFAGQDLNKEAAKVSIVNSSTTASATTIDEIATYVLGAGKTAQFQMTLHK